MTISAASVSSTLQFPVMASHSFDLNLTVLDQRGRCFSNFSSLDLRLESSGETVVQIPLHMIQYGKHSIISVQLENSAELRVTSQTYARKILADEKVFVSQQLLFFKAVSARLALLVMKTPVMVPSLVILNHPENKVDTHKCTSLNMTYTYVHTHTCSIDSPFLHSKPHLFHALLPFCSFSL